MSAVPLLEPVQRSEVSNINQNHMASGEVSAQSLSRIPPLESNDIAPLPNLLQNVLQNFEPSREASSLLSPPQRIAVPVVPNLFQNFLQNSNSFRESSSSLSSRELSASLPPIDQILISQRANHHENIIAQDYDPRVPPRIIYTPKFPKNQTVVHDNEESSSSSDDAAEIDRDNFDEGYLGPDLYYGCSMSPQVNSEIMSASSESVRNMQMDFDSDYRPDSDGDENGEDYYKRKRSELNRRKRFKLENLVKLSPSHRRKISKREYMRAVYEKKKKNSCPAMLKKAINEKNWATALISKLYREDQKPMLNKWRIPKQGMSHFNENYIKSLYIGRCDNECPHCGALLFDHEDSSRPCCGNGKYAGHIKEFEQPLDCFKQLMTGLNTEAKFFQNHIYYFNLMFSMGNIRMELKQFYDKNNWAPPKCIVNGRVVASMPPLRKRFKGKKSIDYNRNVAHLWVYDDEASN